MRRRGMGPGAGEALKSVTYTVLTIAVVAFAIWHFLWYMDDCKAEGYSTASCVGYYVDDYGD